MIPGSVQVEVNHDSRKNPGRVRDDLVIVGAGPAGCAAGIWALRAGLSVTIIEIRSREERLPGETLHPGVEPLFKQLGIWESVLSASFYRHKGIWRESKDGTRQFQNYGQDSSDTWLGFQIDRVRLNSILRGRIGELGGKLVCCRPEGLLLTAKVVLGVTTKEATFPGDFVLDATGRKAWLANKLRLNPDKRGQTRRLRFGWTTANKPDLDRQPLFRSRNDGWNWFAPLGDSQSAWADLQIGEARRGIDYTWRIFRDCAGPGYFLLGDAACLLDPSTGNGVLRALMSGIYAVHLISTIKQGCSTVPYAIDEYKRWVRTFFESLLSHFENLESKETI
jgi:flavin-dependent dehydrogenase